MFKLPEDQHKPGLSTLSEDMNGELVILKAGTQVDESGFYSCYRTGETIKLKKGDKLPECEGSKRVLS